MHRDRTAQVMVGATVACRPATRPLRAGRGILQPAQGRLARHPLVTDCVPTRVEVGAQGGCVAPAGDHTDAVR